MRALTKPKHFIVRGNVHKVLTIVLHTTQVTQTTSLLEVKPKFFFDISCDHLAPSMAIILFIRALHL
jgi:hypothetical protein